VSLPMVSSEPSSTVPWSRHPSRTAVWASSTTRSSSTATAGAESSAPTRCASTCCTSTPGVLGEGSVVARLRSAAVRPPPPHPARASDRAVTAPSRTAYDGLRCCAIRSSCRPGCRPGPRGATPG
jgi:hypothetical protein